MLAHLKMSSQAATVQAPARLPEREPLRCCFKVLLPSCAYILPIYPYYPIDCNGSSGLPAGADGWREDP